jgi:hypothetical protein
MGKKRKENTSYSCLNNKGIGNIAYLKLKETIAHGNSFGWSKLKVIFQLFISVIQIDIFKK